jgi:hypothetical protein
VAVVGFLFVFAGVDAVGLAVEKFPALSQSWEGIGAIKREAVS